MVVLSFWILAAIFASVGFCHYYVSPYFTTHKDLRDVPGPWLARFSNIWLASGARRGKKFAWVHWAHEKYGPIVRIGYNHISIAEPEGLRAVYAHGNGFLKDIYYEAFVSGVPGVFNVRDRADHGRKRKIIAHAFSPGAVHAFEGHMSENLRRWVQQLDRIAQNPPRGRSHARVDMMPWCTYLAFDVIGDLAFGASFGMVDKGRDECESQPHPDGPITITTGAETLNRRGEVSSTLGLLPALRPFAKYLPDPFFSKGLKSVSNLKGIAEVAVAKRLELAHDNENVSKKRRDILQILVDARDASGHPMPREELLSEALTELIAGSDTVSNTACAIFYWILDAERKAPGTVLPRLHAELDAAIPADADIAHFGQVKNLPFLRRCIDEAMRLHSTSAIGLPRIVTSPEGITYGDRVYNAGTVLSVPSYTIHHDAQVWGDDVEAFRPDRWLKENLTPRQALCFNPFSYGPRACVGQNVARMELSLIVGTALHRYDFECYQQTLSCHEGFSKKPDECWLGISKRQL